MPNLDQLAQSYFAFENVDISDFQRMARILQSMWRTEKGYQPGLFQGRKLGNLLPMPWARDTLNNYLSATIKAVVKKELASESGTGKLYGKPRIFNNLLSSQPLCFNLFAELQQDLGLATRVFGQLCPGRVKRVLKMEFEYSPGRGDMAYTGDRSAFDVYVEYLNTANARGFIGIEVKYHENLKNPPANMRDRYFKVASMMGCFKRDCLDILQLSPLEQIWRDHLLAGSLLCSNRDGFKEGFFAILYPQDNPHCREAINRYQQCLSDNNTFKSWTLEEVVSVIKQNTQGRWIDELIDRYLNFRKIETRDKGEQMSIEICSNCEEKIGHYEQAYVFEDKVVCHKCHFKLKTAPDVTAKEIERPKNTPERKIIYSPIYVPEKRPAVLTIERTSKKWKLLKVISKLIIFIGFISILFFPPLSLVILPVGIFLLAYCRLGIWWNHA
jgi:hypothetical protein